MKMSTLLFHQSILTMKSISIFVFVVTFFAGFVACKDAATTQEGTETTVDSTTVAISDEALASTKQQAIDGLTQMKTMFEQRAAAIESQLSSASGEAKATLESQLASIKEYQANIDAGIQKINEATTETWASVSKELESLHGGMKSTLAGDTQGTTSGSLTK